MSEKYDCIVVGAGHAGCEAALASARMGRKTLLLTMRLDAIGLMSCNPAVGGLAKGQLVKEVDALGGEMGKVTDLTALQYRTLNMSKGPAVRSTRAQVDMFAYKDAMRRAVESQAGLTLKEGIAASIIVEDKKARGVTTESGEEFLSKAVIITTGTFLNGLIHIGLEHFEGGRMGEKASGGLSGSLKKNGLELGRLKTGTTPRLDGKTIDYGALAPQEPHYFCRPFSFTNDAAPKDQLPCHMTFTNARTHEVIRKNLDRSPLFTGVIKSTGVRYCPSIEDKVVKFPQRDRHQVFIEPEGRNTDEVYPNGLATSLPVDAQLEFLRTIEGLEDVRILRPGYGIEYDFVYPTQLRLTLETKEIRGLFCAGQINGTTGYEEAAAQGLAAGINASLAIDGREPFILKRSEAYIGVLIDDLVTKGTAEPYRMFTSRAEYRLVLREDNADSRLTGYGHSLGLIGEERYGRFVSKQEEISLVKDMLSRVRVGKGGAGSTASEFLKRPEAGFQFLKAFKEFSSLSDSILRSVETDIKYHGYIQREEARIKRFENLEKIKMPEGLDYGLVKGLSNEIREKLSDIRPVNLGQASRISGVTPAAIAILMVFLKKFSVKNA